MATIIKTMKSINRYEIELIIKGEWKSESEETIYVFSDTASVLKKDSLDLLVSNIKLNNYYLTTYIIIAMNENVYIDIGKGKSSVRYRVAYATRLEIHLENSDHDVVVLKKF